MYAKRVQAENRALSTPALVLYDHGEILSTNDNDKAYTANCTLARNWKWMTLIEQNRVFISINDSYYPARKLNEKKQLPRRKIALI